MDAAGHDVPCPPLAKRRRRQAEAARLLRPLDALPGASGRDLAYAKALLAALEDDA